MLVVPGMSESLNFFFKRNKRYLDCPKCVFVVPVYEIHDDVEYLPKNKESLLQLIENGQARRFHCEVRFLTLSLTT